MRRPGDSLRLLLALLSLLATAALLYLGLATGERALSLWQQMQSLPALLRYALLALGLGFAGAGLWLTWRLLRGGKAPAARAEAIDRERIEARLAALDALGEPAKGLRSELDELEARRRGGRLHVALFGDISAGKSSLLRALLPEAEVEIDVRGGSTREVRHHQVKLDGNEVDSLELDLADVPGRHGADGESLSELAAAEAARAHALVYVADGDLSRTQDADLHALARFGRPLLLVLNKSDRYSATEREALRAHLQQRYGPLGAQVLAISAGQRERLRRVRADGSEDWVERELSPDLGALPQALARIAAVGAQAYEPAREAATLAALDSALAEREDAARARASEQILRRYTRRALVAALATVAPGTDLIIQGGLAAAMLHELARLHGRSLRELDVDTFLKAAGSRVRSHSALLLAIAGNALKAFPGLGTLGGGLVHALAYGLLFDALGRAAAEALREGRALDRAATLDAFEAELAKPRSEAIKRLAQLAIEAVRTPAEAEPSPSKESPR